MEDPPEKLVWLSRELDSEPINSEQLASIFDDSGIRFVFVESDVDIVLFEVVYRDAVCQFEMVDGDWKIRPLYELELKQYEKDDRYHYLIERLSQGFYDVLGDRYNRALSEYIAELDRKSVNGTGDIANRFVDKLHDFPNRTPEGVYKEVRRQDSLHFKFDVNQYQRLDEDWNGHGRPPYVEAPDWIEGPFDDSHDVRKEFRELVPAACYNDTVVYVVDCEFLHPSLQEAIDMAKDRLGHVPEWLETAYLADRVLYVGESGELPKRMETHAFGEMVDDPPPASLTRMTEMKAGGIVFRSRNPDRAKELEAAYAENLAEVSTDDVFFYWN